MVCGLTLGAIGLVKIMLIDNVSIVIALVVVGTLFVTVIIAKLLGCTLPIIAKRIGLDPAVVVNPLITTAVDAISLMVYFEIASRVLEL